MQVETKQQLLKNSEDDLKTLSSLAKHSQRWINCSICGKTITKKSMVSHFMKFHKDEK